MRPHVPRQYRAAHGHADMGRFQGRCVIHPVACHRDHLSVGGEGLNQA